MEYTKHQSIVGSFHRPKALSFSAYISSTSATNVLRNGGRFKAIAERNDIDLRLHMLRLCFVTKRHH